MFSSSPTLFYFLGATIGGTRGYSLTLHSGSYPVELREFYSVPGILNPHRDIEGHRNRHAGTRTSQLPVTELPLSFVVPIFPFYNVTSSDYQDLSRKDGKVMARCQEEFLHGECSILQPFRVGEERTGGP